MKKLPITEGKGYFILRASLKSDDLWPQEKINELLIEGGFKEEDIPPYFASSYEIDDSSVLLDGEFTIMMDNGVTLKEYKDLLDKVGWLIDEDGYGGYDAYNQEHTIHLYFRLNDSSTIYLTIEPLLPYISWPKEEIAMGMEKLGAKEVTFPDNKAPILPKLPLHQKKTISFLIYLCVVKLSKIKR